MTTDPRWTDETQRNVESHLKDILSERLAAEGILDDLASQGLLVTPQMREVVEAARHLKWAEHETAEDPDMHELVRRDALHAVYAAVDTYEAGQQEERQ